MGTRTDLSPDDPVKPPARRQRVSGQTVARWAALLLLGLATLEVASRVEDRVAYGMPLLSRIRNSGDLVIRDTAAPRGRPNAVFRRWRLDSLGFRGPEVSRVAEPGTFRIVVTGASETFGLYEATGKEYPRQLEHALQVRLEKQCAGRERPKVEVINAALPGMALPSMTAHLLNVIAPLNPQLVVLYPSPGFYLNPRAPTSAVARQPVDTSLPIAAALTLRFPERVTTQLKSLLPDPVATWLRERAIARQERRYPQGWKFVEVPPERLARMEEDLRALLGAARHAAPHVMLVGHVNATMQPGFDERGLLVSWENQFPRARGDVIAQFHARALEISRAVASDSSVDFVDVVSDFDGQWDEAFADFVHFTDAGARLFAHRLADSIAMRFADDLSCP
jgi:hypothetical protein